MLLSSLRCLFQSPFRIHCVMQYPDNANHIVIHGIENAVPAVHQAAIGIAIFGCCSTRERIILQNRKFFVKAVHVGFANFLSKLHKTIFVDCTQISNGGIRKRNFSHALLAVWR